MAETTGISWTDSSFNIAWGCVKVSPGCKSCYADALSERAGFNLWGPNTERRVFKQKHWDEPLKWNDAADERGIRHRVFSSSMCDIFEDHPTIKQELARLWPLIRMTPWLDWQLLTKRSERIADCLPPDWGKGYPNVWLGVSVENEDYAHRAEDLCAVPAVVRFISYEPALGPLERLNLDGISWVIYGGESGAAHRADDPQWAKRMAERCACAGVALFYKQASANRPGFVPEEMKSMPREFPR